MQKTKSVSKQGFALHGGVTVAVALVINNVAPSRIMDVMVLELLLKRGASSTQTRTRRCGRA